ncbi:hypothetical protein DOY81_008815 [Sarcophaga bullata]|nr:hypothetical protein DOY81_008815 [Sarcophaga bullata]
MIEMFEVNNNFNATMASAVNLFENLNQSIHDNNLLTVDSELLTSSSVNAFNSTMLTQAVVNTTGNCYGLCDTMAVNDNSYSGS